MYILTNLSIYYIFLYSKCVIVQGLKSTFISTDDPKLRREEAVLVLPCLNMDMDMDTRVYMSLLRVIIHETNYAQFEAMKSSLKLSLK